LNRAKRAKFSLWQNANRPKEKRSLIRHFISVEFKKGPLIKKNKIKDQIDKSVNRERKIL